MLKDQSILCIRLLFTIFTSNNRVPVLRILFFNIFISKFDNRNDLFDIHTFKNVTIFETNTNIKRYVTS